MISIHALLAESDTSIAACRTCRLVFLSTLSLRRATAANWFGAGSRANFYPRSPCGERLVAEITEVERVAISIHALLAESDQNHSAEDLRAGQFLSTLSLRRATPVSQSTTLRARFLSTLSLRRATFAKSISVPGFCNFYPRSPCGERHRSCMIQILWHDFYPRSPCGERRSDGKRDPTTILFLSTLSLRRATHQPQERDLPAGYFYPRSPCGERPLWVVLV